MKHSNSVGEKPRKSLTVVKRSPVSWIRFNLKVIQSETKDAIFKKISRSILNGAKVGKEIIVGANSICRLFESGRVAIVAVCRDSNHVLTDHVIEAARIRHVPIVILPKAAAELASLLQLKRISCFALCNQSEEVSKFKCDIVPSVIDSTLIDKSSTSVSNGPAEEAVTDSTSSASSVLDNNSANTQHDTSGDATAAEKTITEKTDDEIAAALILPAAMDDLRDLLLSVSTASAK